MMNRPTLPGGIALVVVGVWIFWPAMWGGWLWDDELRIVNNPVVHSPDGYWQVWVNSDAQGNYYPLSGEVEWLEWRIFGNHTFGYHLVSVTLHLTSALLLWRLFSRLGFSFAWVGAMLFLVHPLNVESVAWISELKNTLSLPPLLMSALVWLEYDEKRHAESYRGALVWFALSLAAKTAGLMLPVFLVVHAWRQRGEIRVNDLRAIAPFFVLALAAGSVTLWPPRMVGSHLLAAPSWNLAASLASVGWTGLFLLGKCIFPVGLMADYPGFSITHATASDLLPWVLLAVTGALLGMGWPRAAWTQALALGLGFFALNLIPALIYVGKNYEEMTWSLDHLVYVPIIGLIGWGISALGELRARINAQARAAQAAAIGALLLVLAGGSHVYAHAFAGPGAMWAYLLERDPANWRAHDDSGTYEMSENRIANAIAQYQKAIELKPDSDQAYYHLGKAFEGAGNEEEAKRCYLQAAALNPHEMRSYLALAGLMFHQKNLTEAEQYLNQARIAAPNEAAPLEVMAGVMMQTGRSQQGLDLYRQSVRMDPNVEQVRYNFGVALLQAGDFPGAVEQLRAAVDLDGNFAASRENLGVALAQTGAVAEAIEQFKAALAINPDYLDARDNLALALAQSGQMAEAIEQFRKALEINPNDARARGALEKLGSLPSTPTNTNTP